MDQPDLYARTLAELARDPAFASFATPDAALLIWDADAARLIGASPAAERLRWAFADAAGRVDLGLSARGRLQALGAGLAPLAGLRLERLRLDGLSAPVTCACRRVMLDGQSVLVTALLGPLPKSSLTSFRPAPARAAPEPAVAALAVPVPTPVPTPVGEAAAWTPPTREALQRRGAARIVWQADAQARFTAVSPALAEIVGPQAGAVVGRSWDELARSVVEDPGGAVADLMARGQTWSGRRIYWSVEGTPWRVPVDWAGLPVFGPDRALAGFRGFGLVQAAAVEERPPVDAAAPHPEGEPRSAAPDGEVSEPPAQASAPREAAPAAERAPDGAPPRLPGRAARSAETLSRLSISERSAFREIARALGARFLLDPQGADASEGEAAHPGTPAGATAPETAAPGTAEPSSERAAFEDIEASPGRTAPTAPEPSSEHAPTLTGAVLPFGRPSDAADPGPRPLEAARAAQADGRPDPPAADEPPGSPYAVELHAAPEPPRPQPVADAAEAPSATPEPPIPQPVADAAEPVAAEAAPADGMRATHRAERAPPKPVFAAAPVHVLPLPARPAGDRILDRLPAAALVHRDERVIFANPAFLDLMGCDSVDRFETWGGLQALFAGSPPLHGAEAGAEPMALAGPGGPLRAEVSVAPIEWGEAAATLILLRPERDTGTRERLAEAESARAAVERSLAQAREAQAEVERSLAQTRQAQAAAERALSDSDAVRAEFARNLEGAQARVRGTEAALAEARARLRELEAVLDTATDGVAVIDGTGRILSLNRAAEALFGCESREVEGDAITVLLAPESHIVALQYLERLRSSGAQRLLNDGREVVGRVRQGGLIPLFMTMGPVSDGPDARICAVLRDITAFKQAEGELVAAKRVAEEANAQKSDLLAKISHEIRTPLNAIIGFAEVMLEERFGPVGNERYKDYLKDVHLSGTHVISLVNDLLDLAKIEAGRMELAVTGLSLNALISASVALLQPQAARERIVLRTSFAPNLPAVMADERSVRQIALNLLSNAVKFTDPGGQVIVSTALTDRGEVAFRVRDTGIGMSEGEIAAALEPFRQLATARRRGGTGLGLPLTKALVEANRGALVIRSAPNEGTLVEVQFPTARVTVR
ncbi:MAG TPA: PAS domain S-box protein [Microvirga sp.]|jgi:PAS domain S-box-containing protein|nr:PAS domain S-box protein [Microvirga sp.]